MDGLDAGGILQGLSAPVAVVRTKDWAILFENGRFFQLFPPDGGETSALTDRVPDFRAERAAERLERGRAYSFETEAPATGARTVPVRLTLRPTPDAEGAEEVVVEGIDISKEQEVQYMLDSYSKLAERNARDLEKEKERVERLLLNLMPRSVLEELKDYGTTTPQRFDDASILMLDFVGFTSMAISQDPGTVITELNDIFSAFDRIVEMFNCERLKTIGDAYIAVSGVPEQSPDHAANLARVALRMRRYLERRNAAHPQEWLARFGLNTGPVIGSLVGIQKYVYDLFGPGVNLAARMEAISEPMHITVNQATYELLRDEFMFTARGEFDVKGFGTQQLYFLEQELGERRR
jgi:adenylate cyclase